MKNTKVQEYLIFAVIVFVTLTAMDAINYYFELFPWSTANPLIPESIIKNLVVAGLVTLIYYFVLGKVKNKK